MIQKFKKWLTTSTVRSRYNLFKIALLGELILLIAIIVCLCKISNLREQNKELKEQMTETVYDVIEYENIVIHEDFHTDDPEFEYVPQTQKDSTYEK
tara:strand:+ start:642 stop:932 length:291 start_codon:yes stop_codon:yes gene_type:complete